MRTLLSVEATKTRCNGSIVIGYIHRFVEMPDDIEIVVRILNGKCYLAKYNWVLYPTYVLLALDVYLDGELLDVLFLILEGGDHSYAHLLHG